MRKAIILLSILILFVFCSCGNSFRDASDSGETRDASEAGSMGEAEATKDSEVLDPGSSQSGLTSPRLASEEVKDDKDIVNLNIKEVENDLVEQLPDVFDQEVAFVPQAPYAVWDELHKEACEEAAIIIAAKHLLGENLDKEIMEAEIKKLVEWQKENLEKWKDTTAEETAGIIKDYFGLSAELLYKPSADDLKKELVLGKLIVAPTAGRMLDNPYFTAPGPVYHMLVVRGYDQTHFITNDPGTKRGEAYKYTYNNLLASIHDWNENNIRKGERVVIVVGKW